MYNHLFTKLLPAIRWCMIDIISSDHIARQCERMDIAGIYVRGRSESRGRIYAGDIMRITPGRILLIIAIVLAITSLAPAVNAATMTVPSDYPTINDAIANANTGDTIYVRSGTYNENVIVDKSITLIGNYVVAREPLINGTGIDTGSIGIKITADGVKVQGFNVTNSGTGILVDGSNDDVSWNTANNNYYGIYLTGSSNNNAVTANTANNNIEGIVINGTSNYVNGNTVYNNTKEGIFIFGSSNDVSGSTANNNSYGIILAGWVHNNNVTMNMANNNYLGITVSGWRNIVLGNVANNNTDGIYLADSNQNYVFENMATNNSLGIYIADHSFNNVLWFNILSGNWQNARDFGMWNHWNSTAPENYLYDGLVYWNYTGNYWGDYTATGEYHGIGYPPYNINNNTFDYYPMTTSTSPGSASPNSVPQSSGSGSISPWWLLAALAVLLAFVVVAGAGYYIFIKK